MGGLESRGPREATQVVDDPREATDRPPASRPDPYLSGARGLHGAEAARRDNKLATLALASALASFVFLPAIGGLLAIGLGIAARSEMHRIPGRPGAGMALSAILLGGINLLVSAVGAALVLLWVSEMNAPWRTAAVPATLFVPEEAAPPPRPVTKPVHKTRVGHVQILDIDPQVPSLAAEIERQHQAAVSADERLLLWLVGERCAPCEGVEAALEDPAMQSALQGVRLVRLQTRAFQMDLARLRVPTHAIPGFALLGSSGRPIDYIHGGEWDEDIAPNIAPVLGAFVRGQYTERRYPWRGGVRDDETAL